MNRNINIILNEFRKFSAAPLFPIEIQLGIVFLMILFLIINIISK